MGGGANEDDSEPRMQILPLIPKQCPNSKNSHCSDGGDKFANTCVEYFLGSLRYVSIQYFSTYQVKWSLKSRFGDYPNLFNSKSTPTTYQN